MATLSSPGIASGLDVQGIVKQLVAVERTALQPLQAQASSIQTKLSTFGTIRSQVSSLADAASRLATGTGWNGVAATSSDAAAVGVSARAGATPMALSLEVRELAKAQATVSETFAPVGAGVGGGTLTIALGKWGSGGFERGADSPISINIEPGKDSLVEIAAQINKAGAGVSAIVLKDETGERLLLRSTATGEANGFQISTTPPPAATDTEGEEGGASNDGPGLSRLAFNPSTPGSMSLTQPGENAQVLVNNVLITSASNTLSNTVPGLTLSLNKTTTSPVEINVKNDDEAVRKNVQAFVSAYNTLNATLATATRFDAATKVAGPLQGDSTAVGLQNALRAMMRSVTPGGDFTRLADVGIEVKSGGALDINTGKLNAALEKRESLQTLFTASSTDATARGFGLKVKTFAEALLATDGMVNTKTTSLQNAISRNGKEQVKVNERAARMEVRLLAQYNAMDAAVGRLNGLGAFVSQQITLWNQSPR